MSTIQNIGLTDITTVELGNSTIGEDINSRFDKIHNNFNVLSTTNYLKGDKGNSVKIIEFPIGLSITDPDQPNKYPWVYEQNDLENRLTPEKLYNDLVLIITSESESELNGLGEDGYDKIDLICEEVIENGIVKNIIKGSLPFLYLDPNFSNGQNLSANKTNYSCLIIYGDNGMEKLNSIPKLYYDENIEDGENNKGSFCWEINGHKTGIIAQGPQGKNGRDGNCYIVKLGIQIEIDNENFDKDAGFYEIKQVFVSDENHIGWMDYKEFKENGNRLSIGSSCMCIFETYEYKLCFGVVAETGQNMESKVGVYTNLITNLVDFGSIELLDALSNISSNSEAGIRGLFVPYTTKANDIQSGHMIWANSMSDDLDTDPNEADHSLHIGPIKNVLNNDLEIDIETPRANELNVHYDKIIFDKNGDDGHLFEIKTVGENDLELKGYYTNIKSTDSSIKMSDDIDLDSNATNINSNTIQLKSSDDINLIVENTSVNINKDGFIADCINDISHIVVYEGQKVGVKKNLYKNFNLSLLRTTLNARYCLCDDMSLYSNDGFFPTFNKCSIDTEQVPEQGFLRNLFISLVDPKGNIQPGTSRAFYRGKMTYESTQYDIWKFEGTPEYVYYVLTDIIVTNAEAGSIELKSPNIVFTPVDGTVTLGNPNTVESESNTRPTYLQFDEENGGKLKYAGSEINMYTYDGGDISFDNGYSSLSLTRIDETGDVGVIKLESDDIISKVKDNIKFQMISQEVTTEYDINKDTQKQSPTGSDYLSNINKSLNWTTKITFNLKSNIVVKSGDVIKIQYLVDRQDVKCEYDIGKPDTGASRESINEDASQYEESNPAVYPIYTSINQVTISIINTKNESYTLTYNSESDDYSIAFESMDTISKIQINYGITVSRNYSYTVVYDCEDEDQTGNIDRYTKDVTGDIFITNSSIKFDERIDFQNLISIQYNKMQSNPSFEIQSSNQLRRLLLDNDGIKISKDGGVNWYNLCDLIPNT